MGSYLESNVEMEEVEACPLCQSKKKKFLFESYDRVYRFPEKFKLFRCENCGLIRISPRPTVAAINRYYPDEYGAYVELETPKEEFPARSLGSFRDGMRDSVMASIGYDKGHLKSWQKILQPLFNKVFLERATHGYGDLIPNYVPDGKALEVGCGNGKYLGYLKRHGWDVVGLDLSPHAAKMAKKLFDIDVFLGQLEDCPFPDESFDYVHLSHVVEHFFDPLASIKKIHSLLKKGGTAYIEVPNAEGTAAKIGKEYWYGWDPPRHLFMFTPKTIKLMVEKAGFTIAKLRTSVWKSYDWIEAFKQEEKLNKKLDQRPPKFSGEKSKISRLNAYSALIHKVKPDSGDFIHCWVVKN